MRLIRACHGALTGSVSRKASQLRPALSARRLKCKTRAGTTAMYDEQQRPGPEAPSHGPLAEPEAPPHGPLAGFTVGVTAARRADELGTLLQRRGAAVVHAPALRIVQLADDSE